LNLDSSFPQFNETGLEDLCGYAVLKRRVLKPSFLIRRYQPTVNTAIALRPLTILGHLRKER
jgi:hypothetical protein